MNFQELWLRGEAAQSDAINVQRAYIDINDGSLTDGVLFSQIMFWHGYDKNGRIRLRVKKDGHLWLVKRYEDWWDECRIKEHTARKSINRMIDSGLLIKAIYKFDGAPTVHVRINWPEFETRIKSIWHQVSERNDTEGHNEPIQNDRTLTETTTETTTENTTKEENDFSFSDELDSLPSDPHLEPKHPDLPEAMQLYQSQVTQTVTFSAVEQDKVEDALNEFGLDFIRQGVEVAAQNAKLKTGRARWNYALGVARNLHGEQRQVDAAIQAERDRLDRSTREQIAFWEEQAERVRQLKELEEAERAAQENG